ncbi:MAG: NAD(P)/FAD-dependent oxidoreductase [Frankiales bacterium]|nr:NAD(P)/FAD-dependent oxidoreductase [Frankiales bacterium]
MHVVVVGGGIAGSAAALRLSGAGHDVTLLESSPALGGLVVSFEIGGTPLECFYHHIFPNESEILRLIEEGGLSSSLSWLPSTMGVLTGGRVWPFTSPLDVLRFGPLKPLQRLQLGAGALRLMRWRSWEPLDDTRASDWLRRTTGAGAVRELWEPLLRAKFGPAAPGVPAAWMWGRFQQRAAARKSGGEVLGYLRGGFRQLFESLDGRLRVAGVDVRLGARVREVDITDGVARGVTTVDGTSIPADVVLYTGAMPGIKAIVPADHHDPRWNGSGLGVICVVIETDRPVTDVYWTNVCDDELPFGGLIEHTNMVPTADYGGRHVTYLSRYFTSDEEIAKADPAVEAERWLDALAERLPSFDRSSVRAVHPFRAPYAAPLVDLGYGKRIAPMRTEVGGLFVCTTAQIYPHDRGMNEGVVMGQRAADEILAAQPQAVA